MVSISILFAITKLLSRHKEIFHVFSLSSDEVEFSISFVWWLWSFSCSLPRNLLLKTHFAYVVSISILFATTKLLSRHEEIFHVFSLSSDEVDFSIGFIRWLRSFSCSLPIGPYCWKHTLPMWSAYPFCLPQQSCCQDMKKYSTFSLCHLTKLSFLSVLCDDCEAFLVPCLGIDCWKHTLPKWSVYPFCFP